ncbi:hypothetical protein HY636_04640 [Candidatus Woesearchaeota archaeon]|nr:hypothetical protein [Candidatus Woesearchaeota archaeon]
MDQPYINTKIKKLPEGDKLLVEHPQERNLYHPKKLTGGNFVWKSLSAFFGLILIAAIAFLSVMEYNSMPNYVFSLWLFIAVNVILVLFTILFFWYFFDGLFVHFHNDRYFVNVNEDYILIRQNKRATFLPWHNIAKYTIDRRETDNFVTSICLDVVDNNPEHPLTKTLKIPHIFLDSFNKIYALVYTHMKKHEEQIKEWPIVMGLSINNERLPVHISDIIKKKQDDERILYFEAKLNYFWKLFTSILSFVFAFGFIMTALDFIGTTNFWVLELTKYSLNFRIFIVILVALLAVGCLALVVWSIISIIKTPKQQLIIAKEGFIERIFDIVYVIPWKSVKAVDSKWFSYGNMHDKGELKIQITYSDKPKAKACHIYNIQGSYHIDAQQLLNLLTEYWKKE